MTDSETISNDLSTSSNLNKHWKNLDAIFQASLRKYVLTNNIQKFNQLSVELGFDETQRDFLFDSIQTFTTQMQCISTRNVSLSPYPSSHNGHETASNNNSNPLYAIPNNKNERLCSAKRRRSEIDSSDFDESLSENETMQPSKKKKRKTQTKTVDDLWQNDEHITKEKQDELEQDGVYVVEEIVNHKQIGHKKYKYNVKWVGYSDLTWEPVDHLNSFLLDKYWKNKGMIHDKHAAVIYLNQRKKKKPKKVRQSPKKQEKSTKKRKQKENEGIVKEYKCIECNKTFKNGLALGGHNAAKHSKKRKKKEAKEPKVYWEDSGAEDERQMLVCEDSD